MFEELFIEYGKGAIAAGLSILILPANIMFVLKANKFVKCSHKVKASIIRVDSTTKDFDTLHVSFSDHAGRNIQANIDARQGKHNVGDTIELLAKNETPNEIKHVDYDKSYKRMLALNILMITGLSAFVYFDMQ